MLTESWRLDMQASSLPISRQGGENPQKIAMGLHMAIVQRTLSMLRRVGVEQLVLFAGGVAHNPCVRNLLEEHLAAPALIPEHPDMVGALGAALYGISVQAARK